MNREKQNIDVQYSELLKKIITTGVDKGDRTGTGTRAIFGEMIKHDMDLGFPLLTTKKVATSQIISEVIWFMKGMTNIKPLLEQKNYIWVGDAYKNYLKLVNVINEEPWTEVLIEEGDKLRVMNRQEFIDAIISDFKVGHNHTFSQLFGELGPIYGKQWRNSNGVDQLNDVVETIKKNPYSRRLMVNSWNVSEIDDMVLPPCHYNFQFNVEPIGTGELIKNIYSSNFGKEYEEYLFEESDELTLDEFCEKYGIPNKKLSLLWSQRSVDTALGLGFNIASYGIILELIARYTKLKSKQLIGSLGDTHLYSNHIEIAIEQAKEPNLELCKIVLSDKINFDGTFDDMINSLKPEYITFENYQHGPTYKYELSN